MLVVGVLYAYAFVPIVPPITGKLVDAITGKPIPGMNVCLQVETIGWGGRDPLRNDGTTSSDSGRFFFAPSIHHMAFLQGWGGYWIRVVDPNAETRGTCGTRISQWDVTYVMAWPIYLGPGESGKRRYFPVALDRTEPYPHPNYWGAMHRALGFPLGTSIPLIPVLQNAEECKAISDPSLAEDCRQLNIYAAAMSLRENDDDESRNRAAELCREVDHSSFSVMCQAALNDFAMQLRARHLRGDYTLTGGMPAQQPTDLFPAAVGGVPRYEASMYDDGTAGTGRRGYEAEYLDQNVAVVIAQIEEFPNTQRAKGRLGELPGGFPDHAPGTDSEVEFRPDQRIERHHGPQSSGAFWVSDNRVILIRFDRPFASEDDAIATFLTKFPSTL